MYFQLVCNANNNRPGVDGLFQSFEDSHVWSINCIHGDSLGYLAIQWNDKLHSFRPKDLKSLIEELTGIKIDKDDFIFINPCHPSQVKNKYKEEIIDSNIEVIGNWNDGTWNGEEKQADKKYRLWSSSGKNFNKFYL